MKKLITVLFGLMIAGIQAQSPVENRESVKKDLLQNITTPLSGSNISIKEADEALAFHNQARKEVAVEPLLCSAEISGYAQEWANNLAKNGCQLRHRSSAENTKGYGENIALRPSSSGSATDASKAWYNEISKFKNVVLDNTNWYAAGHYSQMIWRKTKKVGIGSAKCTNGYYIVVANYDPPGNYMGQKAY